MIELLRVHTVCYENDFVWRILHVSTQFKYTHWIWQWNIDEAKKNLLTFSDI